MMESSYAMLDAVKRFSEFAAKRAARDELAPVVAEIANALTQS
ncbi:MAG: hypothetical protein VYA84_16045 [Planctomycetota bacterium]|nr:hypothetical protein [Planctomycetota bacterium]